MQSNSWDVALGDVADLLTGHPFKSEFYTEKSGDIRLVRGDNIVQGAMRWDGVKRWPASEANNFERYQLKEGDVVLAMDRPWIEAGLKYASISNYDLPCLLVQRTVRMRGGDNLDTRYLKYVIGSDQFTQHIQAITTGTAVPHISLKQIKDFRFKLPPLAEQQRIASILGALDNKIELNRKMNETLEQMARALFKSWFIDFDPVHAKAAGRQPAGMDKATADLFPDSFVDSDLGRTPKGWTIGSVYEISDVKYGAPFASGLFNSTGAGKPLVRIRDLADESPAIFTTEVHPKGYLLQPGDIAVGMDGEFRAYLWAGVESWLNQRICVFAPKDGFSAAFVRNSIMAPLAEVESTETATTVIHLGKNDIDRFKVVIPNREIADSFGRLCQPWYDRIVANKQESRTLSAIRETLLPKLLNGDA